MGILSGQKGQHLFLGLMDGKYVASIQKKYGKKKLKSFPNMGMLKYVYYSMIKAIQQIKQNLPQANLSEDNYWHTTYSFNKIQSGEALNQVPDYAELGINIRYIPEDNPQEIIKNIQNSCADLAEVETLILAPTLSNSLDNPYIDEYRKIYQSITQNDLVLHKVCGASDARFFSELGMPVILTNFKGGDLHTETEWADYKSMLELKQVLLEYIKKLVS